MSLFEVVADVGDEGERLGAEPRGGSEVLTGAICGVWDKRRLEAGKEKLEMTESMVELLTCNLLIIKIVAISLKN